MQTTINKIDYLNIEYQLREIIECGIFDIEKGYTIDMIIDDLFIKKYENYSLDQEFYFFGDNPYSDLHICTIIDNDYFIPNEAKLKILFKEFRDEIKLYKNGDKIGIMELFFEDQFKEKTQFCLTPSDVLKVAKKMKKKYLKTLKYFSAPFLFACSIYEEKIEETFKEYWFTKQNTLPKDMRNVNFDLYQYFTSEDQIYFDLLQLRNFSNWVDVISIFRIIKSLNKIITLKRFEKKQLKLNAGKTELIPAFFTDIISFYLFKKCINSERKITKRQFGIYFNIFQTQNLILNYQGVCVEFIRFVKKEYNINITRLERNIDRDIDCELKNFKKLKSLI